MQDSIKDSVHKLLSDRINFYGLSDYKISETKIINQLSGTVFIFKGLREQDSNNIKSLEGIDIVWLEEAQKISKKSWEILDPTIRKAGSEIWISMNRFRQTVPGSSDRPPLREARQEIPAYPRVRPIRRMQTQNRADN